MLYWFTPSALKAYLNCLMRLAHRCSAALGVVRGQLHAKKVIVNWIGINAMGQLQQQIKTNYYCVYMQSSNLSFDKKIKSKWTELPLVPWVNCNKTTKIITTEHSCST
jgi:hypothetical protein